jgi:nucleotide-binding universal stress UspA family protein
MTPHVLVPIDFSEAGAAALSLVADLFPSAEVTLLHVVPMPPPAASVATAWAQPSAEDIAALERQVAELGRTHGIASPSVRVTVSEDVGVSILRTAGETSATVIAMPTHGRGGLKRAVLGSVTDYITRHAECAVLTLRGYTKKK